MAEEIIAGPVTALLGKAIAMAAERFGLVPGFKDELKKMEGLVRDIQARVADAESKKSHNPTVLRWLEDFKGATLEAEIVLDELLYEGLRRKVHQTKRRGKVCSFFSLFKHDLSFRMRMSFKVRGINEKLKDIKQEAQNLELAMINHDLLRDLLGSLTGVIVEAANRQTDSLPEQFVAGRSKEESEIVDILLLASSDDNNPLVSVLPIVGMGGLGKTTLAKSIYSNPRIVDHFSKRCWICVSDKFEVTSILKEILESLKGGEKLEMSRRDVTVRKIQNELRGERFLFVLDDVWNTNSDLWDSFFTSLVGLNSANGSCCILTTRLQTTANLVVTSSFNPYILAKLSHDECWFIIGRKATKGGEMPEEFEIYKEKILNKCQGLPLAANAIGGLLSLQRKEDWLSIVENEILKVSESVENRIKPILKLSYDYLPYPRIKKCFAYCSVYSKDTKMDGRELIKIWMAEGYLQDDVLGKTMEEDGVGCLKVLVQSSLLEKREDDDNDDDDNDDFYQMHDLVHDLAESISKLKQHDGDRSRHLALGEKELKDHWNENSMLIEVVEGEVSDEMLLKYRHARVMNLLSGEINKLPNAIGKMKRIRCLTLSLGGIKSLPKSLCKLYNLQTLRLSDCNSLQCLPEGLINLISLRHLHFSRDEVFKMPSNMGRLTHLQTLEFFNVGEKNGREIRELGFMGNLKGSLSIRNLEVVKGKEEASLAKLDAKKEMIELELRWSSTSTRARNGDNWEDEQVLEGLEPCLTLQRLTIIDYTGAQFPRWLGILTALVSLKLDDCKNVTELGHLGDSGFPKLKTLHISGCSQLSSAATSFPVLQKLVVKNKEVSAVKDIISTTTNSLEELRLNGVIGMRSLSDVTESSLSSCLKKLDIWYCDDLTEIPSSTLACCGSLEWLTVIHCRELVSCPLNLQQTPSLSNLDFPGCRKLFAADAIPPTGFEHLTNLKVLQIGEQSIDWDGLKTGCSSTLSDLTIEMSSRTELPQQLQHFSSLILMGLLKFDSLERLPDWLGKLTALQILILKHCPKLEHISSDAMTNLQILHLEDCPKLEYLPTDAMRSLSNLLCLYIYGCPLLRETQGDEINALPNLKVTW